MRAARREINIFNMSLLDILCGALGAFCFMMLVLFPYWKPGAPSTADDAKDKMLLEKQLNEMRKMLAERPDGAAALAQFEQLQRQVQQLQGQLNKARTDSDGDAKKIQQLEMRNPITVAMYWGTDQDFDLFLEPQNFGYEGGKQTPRINGAAKQNANFRDEVRTEVVHGPATELWVARDVAPNAVQKIYYKLFAANGATQATTVRGYYIHDGRFYYLPSVPMSQEKSAIFVGTLTNSPDHRVLFTPAPEWKQSYEKEYPPTGGAK